MLDGSPPDRGGSVATYQVVAVWRVEHPKVPQGADLFAAVWPRGLRASLFDGRSLTVVADVRADSPEDARALVAGRAVLAWQAVAGEPLGAPEQCRVVPRSAPVGVPAGLLPRRAGLPVFGERDVRERRWPGRRGRGPDAGPGSDPRGPHDPPDDGGLAGVREPRRPKPGPGHLFAQAPLPPSRLV